MFLLFIVVPASAPAADHDTRVTTRLHREKLEKRREQLRHIPDGDENALHDAGKLLDSDGVQRSSSEIKPTGPSDTSASAEEKPMSTKQELNTEESMNNKKRVISTTRKVERKPSAEEGLGSGRGESSSLLANMQRRLEGLDLSMIETRLADLETSIETDYAKVNENEGNRSSSSS